MICSKENEDNLVLAKLEEKRKSNLKKIKKHGKIKISNILEPIYLPIFLCFKNICYIIFQYFFWFSLLNILRKSKHERKKPSGSRKEFLEEGTTDQ
jgi:hypothetical protein